MNKRIASENRYAEAPSDIAEEIRASVPLEDDFPSPEELKRELKRSITIRLDPDVYDWFHLPGAGYQTRINAVLRHYMELQKAASSKQIAEKSRYSRMDRAYPPVGAGRAKAKTSAATKVVARKPAKKDALLQRKKPRLSKSKQR
jgi:uncharacterized protein (DUF4415 family)